MSDANLTSVSGAARVEQLARGLRKLTPAGLRVAVRNAAARDPEYKTPWTWADEGGLFYGADGAWLYYQLPITTVAAGTDTFAGLLTRLAGQLGQRPVHLLMYGWEENPPVADGLTDAHADYILSCLRMLVPGHILVVGVQVTEDPGSAKRHARLSNVFTEVVDRSLGEWVPPLDGYAADRDTVAAILAAAGGTPVSGSALDMLESWYNLGISADVLLTERDDSLLLRDTDVIEFCSLRSFDDTAPQVLTPMVSPRAGGAAVVSARGTLQLRTPRDGGHATGVLSGCSIVIGRRTQDLDDSLDEVCAAINGVEAKPLPMRQLLALEETLPCAQGSVDPHLFNVDAERLSRVGFHEPIPAGDRSGLLVGLVEPEFSYPLYLDMLNTPAYLLGVVGGTGAGKTFLLEHLALQAAHGGRAVVFLRAGGDAGDLLVGAAGASVTSAPVAGMLDPFARLHEPQLAVEAVLRVLRVAVPGLTAEEVAEVRRGLDLAALADVHDTGSALRMVMNAQLAARLVRFTRTPAGSLMCAQPDDPARVRTQPSVWDLAGILGGVEDPQLVAVLADLAVAVAQTRARGGFLAADEVGDWSDGTLARTVSAALGRDCGALAVTARNDDVLTSGRLPRPTATVVLSCPEGEADRLLASAAPDSHVELAAWLRNTFAVIDDTVVYQPALGIILDRAGGQAAMAVGPVPKPLVGVFTRGAAARYAADTD